MCQLQNKLYTIKKAANLLGIQYRQLLAAVNQHQIPYYQIQKSRRLVKVDEVMAALKQGHGGQNE